CVSLCVLLLLLCCFFFFFSSRRRHTRWPRDWSSDVCSSDLICGTSSAAADDVPQIVVRQVEQLRKPCILWICFHVPLENQIELRSGERRVGKECRARWGREY